METNKRFILSAMLFAVVAFGANAQKVLHTSDNLRPRWLKSMPTQTPGANYEFKLVENSGDNLKTLQLGQVNALGSYLQQTNKIEGVIKEDIEEIDTNEGHTSTVSHKLSFQTETSIEAFQCILVDNYWEEVQISSKETMFNYYTLYAVSNEKYPRFDRFVTTTQYGASAMWRSALVPGWGQLYKGSTLKGSLMLGGTAAAAAAIVYTENMRSVYANKMNQTHNFDHRKFYNNKRHSFAIARNACIGAAASLYIYNIVDALVAPGARYIKVSVSPEGSPVAMASFNF